MNSPKIGTFVASFVVLSVVIVLVVVVVVVVFMLERSVDNNQLAYLLIDVTEV